MVECVCPRYCIYCSIPSIFIACRHIVCGVIVLGDCEVQGVSAEASIVVCIVVSICTALRVVDIVPCILFASIMMIGVVGAVVDCEVEGIDVGAG